MVRHSCAVAAVDPDLALRQAAGTQAPRFSADYDDVVPIDGLRDGFEFAGARVSFGSFQRGIHRARIQRGPAALTLMTSFKDPLLLCLRPRPRGCLGGGRRHYDEQQVEALALSIAGINAWNRINVITRQITGEWV
jgi:hypothetical protein